MWASNDGNDPVETTNTIGSPRVLLVDDSPSDCLRTCVHLRRHNVLVTAVKFPWQALELLNQKSPKLNHLPVVIISDDMIHERVKRCLDGGAKDYIQKPMEYSHVTRILSYI
uniref:Response regulatory domain-containing protein n=1 Tax=Setaria italica TaxID=4555 RepID=K3YKV5_SETIT